MKFLNTVLSLLVVSIMLSCSKRVMTADAVIIPSPEKMQSSDGQFVVDSSLSIGVSDESLMPIAELLQSLIAKSTGIKAEIAAKGSINLSLDSSKAVEAYKLSVTKDGVEIVGGGYGGVLYGVESLRQLMPKEVESDGGAKDLTLAVGAVEIEDAPRFPWRGYMLDVSRHFFDKQEIKGLLDMMAFYKMNRFHWHLTDDQGWRIEIKKYPLLTEKGAWREFNNQDRICQARAKAESNPDLEIDPAKLKVNGVDTLYGGYYTQEDIKEIVAYAKGLNIEIIPEIDMPGHFLAAVENYKGVSCSDEIGWGTLFSSPVCPGKDHALEFCRDIYSEIFELFPYEYVHLGADEVEKDNWKKCPDCQARIRKHGLKNEEELQSWFVKHMEKHFNDNGKKLIGWDEIIEGGLSDSATVMWWRSWHKDAVPVATAQGNRVVFSPNANLYLDYDQDKSSLENIYIYNPTVEGMTPEQESLIEGVQANLWCEYVPSIERAEYMTFPRMLALSEIAWASAENKDYDKFLDRAASNLEKLDVMGVNYRPLDIEGFKNSHTFTSPSTLEIVSRQKGITFYYTEDGSVPTDKSTKYSAPIQVDKTTEFKIRLYRPDGSAADIIKTTVFIEDYVKPLEGVSTKGSGLSAKWYDYKGDSCDEIESAKFNKEFIIDSVSIPSEAKGNIGLIIDGYFEIAEDGIYTFVLVSDDGSMLYINDILVVDNGGPHGPREVVGQKALSKGTHSIKMEYFDYNGGMLSLDIMDSKDRVIPATELNFRH